MSSLVKQIVLFDGDCQLCSRSARFIARRDPVKSFALVSQRSPQGRNLLSQNGFGPNAIDSLVLLKDGQALVKSTAALEILKGLSTPWKAFLAFSCLPLGFRDGVYDLIARNRHRLGAGKRLRSVS